MLINDSHVVIIQYLFMVGDIHNIIVFESLSNERMTGTELYNDCIKRNIEFRNSKITHRIYNVNSKELILDIFKYYEINAHLIDGGLLIHLEMHGDVNLNGLVLSNNSLLSWKELAEALRPINIKTSNSLYLSMATCNGRFLYKGVDVYLKSPYSCYISASTEVSPENIIDEFTILFENLIDQGNLIRAYLNMEEKGTKFFYKDSKEVSIEAFKITLAKFKNDPSIKEGIIKETEEECRKLGIPAPEISSYDIIMQKAFNDSYEKLKSSFKFKNE